MLGLVSELTVLVAVAPATTVEAPDDEAVAAERFSEGRAHFAEERYEAALAAFREAYRIAPHDKVRFNIAQCLLELGRAREAFAEFDEVAASPQLSADERELARTAAETAATRLGTLRFTGEAGRTVVVDDDLRCTVPCTLDVDSGVHHLRVEDGASLGETRIDAGKTVEVEVRTATPDTPAVVTAPRLPPSGPGPSEPPVVDDEPPKVRPSALTWVGVSLTAVGGAGILGFGLRARSLHDDYVADPDVDTRNRGLTARNLTNVSIGVAALGGALVLADLVRLAVLRRRR